MTDERKCPECGKGEECSILKAVLGLCTVAIASIVVWALAYMIFGSAEMEERSGWFLLTCTIAFLIVIPGFVLFLRNLPIGPSSWE